MRILIITQKINVYDPGLGFFHRWLKEFSKHFETITAICLEQGTYDLPQNIRVFSLGKEDKKSKLAYIKRFFTYIIRERNTYDAVFVHMNEEYILLGGLLWRLMGKKVTMWRNHHKGSIKTRIAGKIAHKVYCPSQFSFTASFPNAEIMPVGIDTDFFIKRSTITETEKKKQNSILFLARISPVKKPHILIEALQKLASQDISFTASIYGDALPSDQEYLESLHQKVRAAGLEKIIHFLPGIPNDMTPTVYNQHEITVNLSSSGMYDKTIFEAMACETLSLSCNKNLVGEIDEAFYFEEDDVNDLAAKIRGLLLLPIAEKESHATKLREYVLKNHGLKALAERLKASISELC